MNKKCKWSFLSGTVLLLAFPVYANMGLPMLFVIAPFFLFSFIPIILFEAYAHSLFLPLNFKESIPVTVISNLVSTLFGIPVTWLLAVALQIATDSLPRTDFVDYVFWSAWLNPGAETDRFRIPGVSLILLVPFFVGSVLVEFLTAKIVLRSVLRIPRAALIRSVFFANLISYLLLAAILMWYFVFSKPMII